MKICVAQTRPVKGDILGNIEHQKKLIALSLLHHPDIIIFPELSVTGYEPELAKQLATAPGDSMFEDFQKISDAEQISIGVGMPLKSESGILIGMILFQPHLPRETYHKQYLHADEDPYFVSGQKQAAVWDKKNKIALAICYELSIPAHAEAAHKAGAEIYIVSAAKSASGAEKAVESLAGTAGNYSMTVLMSNCVGLCDGVECGGNTSAWNNKGILAGQLNDTDEGVLIFDTATGEAVKMYC